MKTPYLSIKQRFLLLVTAALFFGLTTPIHAEGLSGLKDSLNKGKIDSTTIEQTKQQSDISDVPQNSISADKPAAKLQAPVNNVKIKKPARIKEVQAKKSNSILKRIGAPVKTPDRGSYSFSISNFPTIDEKKYNPEALTMLKAMREKATGYANIESDLSDFCAKYPVYTELCNLGRLYLIQQQLKNNKIYDFKTKKYLDELTSEFVYGSNEVTAFIDNEVNLNMVPWLNEFNEKKISQAHTYVLAEIKRLKQEISDITSGIFKPGDLEYLKTEIALKYKRTMEAYYGIALTHLPDRARAKELRDEITNFYNSLSPKIPVSVKMDQNSNPVTIEIDIIKDSRMFILMSSNFVQSDFEHCQFYSTDDKIFNNILSEKSGNQININTFEDLKSRINNPLKGETALEQWEKDNYINHIDKYRKCVSKIKQLYFQKGTSYLGTLSPDYVAKTSECILLKAQVICDDPDPSNFLSRPPIKIEFFSNVSKISSEVTLKKYAITNDYCAVLGNNTANLWPVNDKSNIHKINLAIIKAELGGPTLDNLYKNPYFNNKAGFGSFNFTTTDFNNLFLKLSYNFFRAAGVECVQVQYKDIKNLAFVRNQADWLIYYGHGNVLTGSIGTTDSEEHPDPNAIIVTPGKDKFDSASNTIVPGLINADGVSEYVEDLNVLMLTACGVLNTKDNIRKWYTVLPNGIVLGFNLKINPAEAEDILFKVNELLKNNAVNELSFDELGKNWRDFCKNVAEKHRKVPILGRYNAGFYTFIYNNKCYKGSIKEHKNWLGTIINTEFIEDITIIK